VRPEAYPIPLGWGGRTQFDFESYYFTINANRTEILLIIVFVMTMFSMLIVKIMGPRSRSKEKILREQAKYLGRELDDLCENRKKFRTLADANIEAILEKNVKRS